MLVRRLILFCRLRRLSAGGLNVMSIDPRDGGLTSVAVLCKIDSDLPADTSFEADIISVVAVDRTEESSLRLAPTTMATGLSSMLV